MTESLFRFFLQRPAVALPPELPPVKLDQGDKFQDALLQASKGDAPYASMVRIAQDFVSQPSFVGSLDAIPVAAPLARFSAALDKLQAQSSLDPKDVFNAVSEAFEAGSPQAVTETDSFKTSVADLKDSLLAIKQLQEEHGRPIEGLTNQLRDLELLEKLATDPDPSKPSFPCKPGDLANYRTRLLQLPDFKLKPIVSDGTYATENRTAAAEAETKKAEQINGLLKDISTYRSAMSELNAFKGEHYIATAVTASDGFEPPDPLKPLSNLSNRASFLTSLADINLNQLKATLNKPEGSQDPLALQDNRGMWSASHIADRVLTANPTHGGFSNFRPKSLSDTAFRLNADALRTVSEPTTTTVRSLKLPLETTPVSRAVTTLQTQVYSSIRQLERLGGPGTHDVTTVKRVNGTSIFTRTPAPSPWTDLIVAGGTSGFFPWRPPHVVDPNVPATRGNVAPAGVADLLVVNQQLKGYEATDIASIENVLKGENKNREFTATITTTNVSATDTTTATSDSRDLESASRYEMSKEADSQVKTDASLKAGVTVSASYGPAVKLTASVEGAASSSRAESAKTASKFSQDVTQKSEHSLATTVLAKTALTVTNESVDKATHGINNVAGATNISGVYQYINKVYEAQVFNYGIRTMYDFMIPEPAAFLIGVSESAHAAAVSLEKPYPFTLSPGQIDELNYGTYVSLYRATGISAPPDVFKTFGKEMSGPNSTDDKVNFNHTDEITVDTGYQAIQAAVGCVFNLWEKKTLAIDVVVGTRSYRFVNGEDGYVWITGMADESGAIPCMFNSFGASQVAITFEIKCQRTERAMVQWALDTHGKLMDAYNARLQEYSEQLAQLQLNAGLAIQGTNPASNLLTMRNEVKKNCVSILTDQHFDLFDAVDEQSSGLPQIDIPVAASQGAYVRFFEEAFEWEQMTWLTYPYFWGRKGKWQERLAISDPDPLYDDFLKAGFCRAVVPARPGYEGAIDHYMTYGELWNGGPLPTISSPLYLPIAAEIAERLGKPQGQIAQGEAWDVRVPTTLVKLRQDDSLPKWTKQADGTWTPS